MRHFNHGLSWGECLQLICCEQPFFMWSKLTSSLHHNSWLLRCSQSHQLLSTMWTAGRLEHNKLSAAFKFQPALHGLMEHMLQRVQLCCLSECLNDWIALPQLNYMYLHLSGNWNLLYLAGNSGHLIWIACIVQVTCNLCGRGIRRITGLPEVIENRPHCHPSRQTNSSLPHKDSLAVFTRWYQCAPQISTWFLEQMQVYTSSGMSDCLSQSATFDVDFMGYCDNLLPWSFEMQDWLTFNKWRHYSV